MPDYVGLHAESPDIMGKLSQLLSIRQQQQGLRTATAEAQSAEQSARQRKALAEYDFTKHIDESGLPDLHSMVADPELHAAAGDQFQEVLTHAAVQRQQQIGNIQALTTLRTDQRKNFADMMAGLRSDPDVAEDNDKARQKVNNAMIQFGETYGEDALPVLSAYAPTLQRVPKGKMQKALAVLGLQTASADKQVEAQAPHYVSVGGKMVDVNPVSAPGAAPKELALSLPPGFSLYTDPRTNNTYGVNTQTGELADIGQGVPGGGGAGGGTGGGAPTRAPNAPTRQPLQRPASMPAPFAPGQQEAINAQVAGLGDRVQKSIEQSNTAPQAIDALSRARTILDTDIATGGTFAKWKNVSNMFAGLGMNTDTVTDRNSLVKNLARYEASRASASGLGSTDAARELAHKGSPNTEIDKDALKGIITQSMATELAIQGYSKIQSGQTDPAVLARQEQAFHAIPNLVEAYEYGLARNKEEADEFLKKHGLTSAQMKKSRDMIRKLGAL